MDNRYNLDGMQESYQGQHNQTVNNKESFTSTETKELETKTFRNDAEVQEPSTVFEYGNPNYTSNQNLGYSNPHDMSGTNPGHTNQNYNSGINLGYTNQNDTSNRNLGYNNSNYTSNQNPGYMNGNFRNSQNNGYEDTMNQHTVNTSHADTNNPNYENNSYTDSINSMDTNKKKKKKKGNFTKQLGKCAALAVVFGLVGGGIFHSIGYLFRQPVNQTEMARVEISSGAINDKVTTTNTSTQAVVSDVSEVVANVMPSIVSITNMSVQEYQGWFGQVYSEEIPNAGSGIIVSQTEEDLYIVTNNHVVEKSSSLTVNFVDDKVVPAEIKGTDSSTDLAVITVKIADIPEETLQQIKVATLGNSDLLRVGEPSIAIGNALGYGQSVTTGVISALDREVTISDNQNGSITNSLIQTDAAINPGNSGGALLNIKGEVIGINSVKYSDTKVEGMGYAIPMATAEPIINDLITQEVVDEADSSYLGISGVDVTDEVSENYNMPKGVYVAQVEQNSAADVAGIKAGDIITSFGGRKIESMEGLVERMQYYAAGTTVDVVVQTADQGVYTEKTISVTLGRKK